MTRLDYEIDPDSIYRAYEAMIEGLHKHAVRFKEQIGLPGSGMTKKDVNRVLAVVAKLERERDRAIKVLTSLSAQARAITEEW